VHIGFSANVNRVFGADRNIFDADQPERPEFAPDERRRTFAGFDAIAIDAPLRVLNIPPHTNLDNFGDTIPGWTGEFACLDFEGPTWAEMGWAARLAWIQSERDELHNKWPNAKAGMYGMGRFLTLWRDGHVEPLLDMLDVLMPTHYVRTNEPQADKLSWWAEQAKQAELIGACFNMPVIPMLDCRIDRNADFANPETWDIVPHLYRHTSSFVVWDTPNIPGDVDKVNHHICALRDRWTA
jgi:hypothetical protein